MPLMKFKNVPKESRELAVEVPEFGEEDGEPYSVLVRGLTVEEWRLLTRDAFRVKMNGNGPSTEVNEEHDELSFIVAACSYDEEGNRVFGRDLEEAIERVKNMPYPYRPALMRIYRQALELSGIGAGAAEGEPGASEGLSSAEKN